jgi:ketosteroid isomerase-like protein
VSSLCSNGQSPNPTISPLRRTAIAFYQAFEKKDVDGMMVTWAEDEDIVCVHPGGPRLVGYDAVRAGWEQLFSGDTKLSFRLDEIVVLETVGMALQSTIEHVTVGDDPKPRGAAIATNVFLRTPSGWRLAVHHASLRRPLSSRRRGRCTRGTSHPG